MTKTGRHRVVIASLAAAVASLYPRVRGADDRHRRTAFGIIPLPPHTRG